MNYRPDIDGLRAISIIAVVAFHAFPEYVVGGFVGVDVFFVISGYLISKNIYDRISTGNFSYKHFLFSRIRRIFPALAFVLISSLLSGYFLLSEQEYKELGKYVFGASLFVSNFQLLSDIGYFDTSSERKPLLHLWSLSIEEQFYMFWPLILVLSNLKNKILVVSVIFFISSFVLSVLCTTFYSEFSFYSPVTRIWELLLGSLLAWHETLPKKNNAAKLYNDLFSWLGLLLFGVALWIVNPLHGFPGPMALLPTISAMLVIASGSNAFVNMHVLSHRFLVAVGLISYPLYLWHWPIFSFVEIINSGKVDFLTRSAILFVSIFLSIVTYRFIEQPLKKGRLYCKSIFILPILVAFSGAIGLIVYSNDGLPNRGHLKRLREVFVQFEKINPDDPKGHENCVRFYGIEYHIPYCNMTSAGIPNVAIIGDSHARVLYDGLIIASKDKSMSFVNIGGKPFLGLQLINEKNINTLKSFNGGVSSIEVVIKEPSIHTVIIAYRANEYLNNKNSYRFVGHPDNDDGYFVFESAMRRTLDQLVKHNKNVIFLIDNPELDFDPHECIPRPIIGSIRNDCSISRVSYESYSNKYRNLVFAVIQDYPTVKIFDSANYLCDDARCNVIYDNKLLYRDNNHLSIAGATYLAEKLIPLLPNVLPRIPN